MRIVLAGVPGAGKTTILKYLRDMNVSFDEVNFGDVMFDLAKKEHGVENRDEMRTKLSEEEQKELQKKAAEKIANMDNHIIVNTHAAIRIGNRKYLNGLPEHVIKALKPHKIVLLEYNPDVILDRRKGDSSRVREMESPEDIEHHQKINYEYAKKAAKMCGANVVRLELRFEEKYPFHHAKYAAERLKEIIGG